ncbi:hypothetical protein FB451DRAFT_1100503 [Mycena latifolia]|nr:hypothetical protein FB451DRAFT_1100503 [Mycena latifolia]
MADIIGLVASVLQLVDTVAKARGYIRGFHNAPREQQRLLLEIQNLQPLVRELDRRILDNQAAGLTSGLQEFQQPLMQLKRTIERLTKKLNWDGFSSLSDRLTWPLWGKEDIEEGLTTLEQFKSLLNAWLGIDIWNSTRDLLSTLRDTAEEQRIDQNYIAKSVRDVARKFHNQERYSNWAERDKIIEWFSPLNFFLRQADISSTRQPGTGEWFLQDELFKKWKSGAGKHLCCRGMPGAGKTVLASMVVDHLRTTLESRNIGIAAMYLSHQETEVQSLSNLLAGLWRQLVVGKSIPPALSELYEKHREQGTNPSLEQVDSLLLSAISQFSGVFIVVDAIDEYHEQHRHILLHHLSSLTVGSTVKLMLTSRPHLTINHVIEDLETLEIKATEDDIRRHVDAEILKSFRLSRLIQNRPDLRQEIEEIIVRRSDGMFLLAKLHTDSIVTKHTVKAVRDALTNMAGDLNSTYDEVMERINLQSEEDKALAWRALSWVTNAKRPLRPSELREALAVEHGTAALDPDNLLDIDTILSVCAGLVVINQADKRIRLIHYTMQNYFNDIQATAFPRAATEITTTCITYLSFDILSQRAHDPMALFHEYSLLDYAVEYCLIHARGRPESDIKGTILTFLETCFVWWKLWNWKCSYEKRRKSADRLWIATAFHLDEICWYLIQEDACSGDSILQEAAFEGLTDMVDILLANGVHPDATPPADEGENGRALQAASGRGHTEIINLLLDHGADINFPCHLGTALQMAAFFGHKESVCLLISRGANVNIEGGRYGTALIAAAFRNNCDIVQILLENDADIEARSGSFSSALHAASGHKAICDLLIERGARVYEAFSFDNWPLPFSNMNPQRQNQKSFSVAPEKASPLAKWTRRFAKTEHLAGRTKTNLHISAYVNRRGLARVEVSRR